MASAQSLLGLMTQLQNLESNVASILIEASLKLCSLTDINIFFLIETADGRRFAGNRQLCDRFRQGGLLAADSDIECIVNPAISALEERGPTTTGVSAAATAASRSSLHRLSAPLGRSGINGFDSISRKRSFPLSSAALRTPKTFKSSKGSPCLIGEENGSGESGKNGGGGGGDLARDSFDIDEGKDVLAIDIKDEDAADSNNASADGDVAEDNFTHFDLADDDIVEVPLSDRSASSRGLHDSIDSSAVGANDSFGNWQISPSSSHQSRHQQQQQQVVPAGQPVMDFINDIYPQSLLDKLKALDSFDVDVIFDPAAAPRKVLNSILHEVGTKLATSCPYWPRHLSNPQLKEWLISNIEVFIGKFPVMQRICDDRHKVYIGKKAMSKLTYVKNNIRSSYDKQFKSNPKDHEFCQVLA